MTKQSMNKLVDLIDQWLEPNRFSDYCVNGLQVEGRQEVKHIATAVTASEAAIMKAIDCKADALLVHHGIFWRGDRYALVGVPYRRCRLLLRHNIGLLAYHLPLDAHSELGNNAQLAKLLGIDILDDLHYMSPSIGNVGQMNKPVSADEFALLLEDKLSHKPLVIKGGGDQLIRRVAWCSGAAQDALEQAHSIGADAFFSGEISEKTYHLAHELGIHYFAAGHHATERYGVQALGKKLAQVCGLKHTYLEIDNPV